MKKINIGDWVTQYRTGYWKVKELHPKYSPFDCDRLHKGEPIGVEAVLQKAFNNTFKFNMEMSTCDLSLCQHVTKAVMRKIEKYFKEHPDDECSGDFFSFGRSRGTVGLYVSSPRLKAVGFTLQSLTHG